MAYGFPFHHPKLVLSGDVASLHFIVRTTDEHEFDQRLISFAIEVRGELEAKVRKAALEVLGPQFQVRSITFRGGSIEVLVIIGTVYYAVSHYKQFVESLELLVSHLRELLGGLFSRVTPHPVSVQGRWQAGPALAGAEAQLTPPAQSDITKMLVWYMIISHSALLATFILLVLTWMERLH